MRKGSWFTLALLLLAGGVAIALPRAGWFAGETLRGGSGGAFPPREPDREQLEEAERLARDAVLRSWSSGAAGEWIGALVYSRYPFNLKHELLISRGGRDGVAVRDIVGVAASAAEGAVRDDGCGVLLGRVTDVFSRSALVETVFDPRLQLAVRIGSRGADGLLRGGASPLVTLISQKAHISPGDAVYAASTETPYGMALGRVAEVRPAGDEVFQNAVLEIPYDVNAVRGVCIRKPPTTG